MITSCRVDAICTSSGHRARKHGSIDSALPCAGRNFWVVLFRCAYTMKIVFELKDVSAGLLEPEWLGPRPRFGIRFTA